MSSGNFNRGLQQRGRRREVALLLLESRRIVEPPQLAQSSIGSGQSL